MLKDLYIFKHVTGYRHCMSRCPKTSMWIPNPVDRYSEDAMSLTPFRELIHPVFIRGEPHHAYDFKNIKRWFEESRTSPTTREHCTLTQLEPLRYPGFKRYFGTVNALRNATRGEWRPMPDADNVPSVMRGMWMQPPQWPDHPVSEHPPAIQEDKEKLWDFYGIFQDLSTRYLYDDDEMVRVKTDIDILRENISRHENGEELLEEFDQVHETISSLINEEKCLMQYYVLLHADIGANPEIALSPLASPHKRGINVCRQKISRRPDGESILRLFDGHRAACQYPPV